MHYDFDQFPGFINVLNDKAKNSGLQGRVQGVVGSMDDLDFRPEEFDLIWSEGAIDNIGFEKGLHYWRDFLKPGLSMGNAFTDSIDET